MIRHSHDGVVQQSAHMAKIMGDLRAFLFANVYEGPHQTEQTRRAERMIEGLYTYYIGQAGSLPAEYEHIAETQSRERAVMDYIAGMSDNFAVRQFLSIYVPGEVEPYVG